MMTDKSFFGKVASMDATFLFFLETPSAGGRAREK